MSEPILTMRGVGRVHGHGRTETVALADIDLELRPGELVAVTGRSGSGKSTLCNLAGGLDHPTSGTVQVDGRDLAALNAEALAALRRRRVGVVFQHRNLIPTLTAVENIALPLELDGASPREAACVATAALGEVAERSLGERYPDELSGGEQQRVAIARGLIGERGLLVADEPTGALDETTAEDVLALLRRRIDEGAAGLMVTHDPAQAAWADRVVRLRDGRIESVVGAAGTNPGKAGASTGSGRGHTASGVGPESPAAHLSPRSRTDESDNQEGSA